VRKFLVVAAVLAAVLTAACSVRFSSDGSSPAAAAALSQVSPGNLPTATEPVEAVVRRVLPAVVNVTSDIVEQSQTGGSQQGEAIGTGFIVRSDGIIVTNCHVVEGASKLTVSTSATRPVQYAARVIGGDCLHDVAILKVSATNLPTVGLGSSASLQLGQRVVALGYALALEGGPTVTTGIVSALNRTIQAQDAQCQVCKNGSRTYTGVIQTDAAINHGNSGGPLVNMEGQVVGINSAGDDNAQNIGFAIAIDSVKDIVAKAETDPLAAAAYIGVSAQTVTPDVALQFQLKTQSGAYIVETVPGGPAASAGIHQGDVVVSVNGSAVTGAEQLGTVLDGLKPGQSVPVVVVGSNGTRRTVNVTLGTRPLPTTLP
jgi:S1-C subfamily serine protease